VAWWEARGSFCENQEDGEKQVFSMVLPPPNVTGQLHIGHALTVTIQDALVRWSKMRGMRVEWVPGVDHAGIATQSVVEKQLLRDRGITRHDLGRDGFVAEVWQWYKKYNDRINDQLRRLGAGLDWRKKVFTMDEERSQAVVEAFVELHKRGHIYRGERLVSWCPHLQSVISDLEVDYEEIEGPREFRLPGREIPVEFGKIHDFAYKVSDGSEVVVSTTRLETMFGDSGIAVHPDDERYKHLIGDHALHPFFPDRRMPIVADRSLVDLEVGTGAVKLTPGHSVEDNECGIRHGLEVLTVIEESGRLSATCGEKWEGIDRFDVRELIVEELKKLCLYRGSRDHAMKVARCSRSGDVIEWLIKPQWFVDCSSMARRTLDLSRTGNLQIRPARWSKTWERWLTNPRDWCISRQLWWGHRIPAYRMLGTNDWIVAKNLEEAQREAKRRHGSNEEVELEQDSDVLDTWFSSGLFPLSALGWPRDLREESYPLTLMETGSDLIFFWVARMVMLCSELHAEGTPPFREVFFHPMIRDKEGRKMSKSLGNVIDPIDVVQGKPLAELLKVLNESNLDPKELNNSRAAISKDYPEGFPACGTDALRLALMASMNAENAINLDIRFVENWRKFCNKLWNAQVFVKNHALGHLDAQDEAKKELAHLLNRWILSRLAKCSLECDSAMHKRSFHHVTASIQDFLINDFCDVFLECCKFQGRGDPQKTMETLITCLESTHRLLHPIAPFVTEELWQRLLVPDENRSISILDQEYVSFSERDLEAESEVETLLASVRASRGLLAQLRGVADEIREVEIKMDSVNELMMRTDVRSLMAHLARVDHVLLSESEDSCPGEMVEPFGHGMSVAVKFDAGSAEKASDEVRNLGKKIETLEKRRQIFLAKMSGQGYIEKAPGEVKERDQKSVEDISARIQALKKSVTFFRKISS